MKTETKFTIELNPEEITILRDLVRIGMKSKYYQEYLLEDFDDVEFEDARNADVLAVLQFVNLCPVSRLETSLDARLFEGVAV